MTLPARFSPRFAALHTIFDAAELFDSGRREAWLFSLIAVLLVIVRSARVPVVGTHRFRLRPGNRRTDGQAPERVSGVSTIFLRSELHARRAVVVHRAPLLDRPSVDRGPESATGRPQYHRRPAADARRHRLAGAAPGCRIRRGAPVHRADAGRRRHFPADAREQRCRADPLRAVSLDASPAPVRVRRAAGVRLPASRVHGVCGSRPGGRSCRRSILVDAPARRAG